MRFIHSATAGLLIVLAVAASTGSAANPVDAHRKAVELGRAGDYAQALAMLRQLLEHDPANYDVRRDAILIAAWSGDCRAAIRDYRLLGNHDAHENYLLATVGECLSDLDRPRRALALLHDARQRYPADSEIQAQRERAEKALVAQPRPRLETEFTSDSSDQGNVEWRAAVKATQEFADRLRVYGRYLAVRAADPRFATGDLNRVGMGAIWRPDSTTTLTGAYAWDLARADESGAQLTAEYAPTGLWVGRLSYDRYSEDVPLRAKAQGISTDRKEAGVDYHTADWKWEAGTSVSGFAFSDSNQRTQFSGYAGYATELKPRREQRFTLGLYQSRNTLPAGSTVYYNPVADQTVSLNYKLTHIRDSRFRRLVDHIRVSVGLYAQESYGTNPVYGVAYEQEIEPGARSALNWRISLSSNVYDGRRETGLGAGLYYRRDY